MVTTYLHGMTKPAAYAAGFPESMKQALQSPAPETGRSPMRSSFPSGKDADWWALDQDSRARLMQEHTQAALPYQYRETETVSFQRLGRL